MTCSPWAHQEEQMRCCLRNNLHNVNNQQAWNSTYRISLYTDTLILKVQPCKQHLFTKSSDYNAPEWSILFYLSNILFAHLFNKHWLIYILVFQSPGLLCSKVHLFAHFWAFAVASLLHSLMSQEKQNTQRFNSNEVYALKSDW